MGCVVIGLVMVISAVLAPVKGWFGAREPVAVKVSPAVPSSLMLTDLFGNVVEQKPGSDISLAVGERTVEVEQLYPTVRLTPGVYVLYVVPADSGLSKQGGIETFEGTPLVIDARVDKRPGAPAGIMVTRVTPLRYVQIDTAKGKMRAVLYYDTAPHTVENFIELARQGFYDGMTFHRVVPGFVIQTGDPRGDGTGGPGYSIDAEFSDRAHQVGVMSMARMADPNEPRLMPRPEFANSAGSQFFICLDYDNTQQLDGRYTAFGRVIDGIDVVEAIGKGPVADERTGRPKDPVGIGAIRVVNVTPGDDPYLVARVGKLDVSPRVAPTTLPLVTSPGEGMKAVHPGTQPVAK